MKLIIALMFTLMSLSAFSGSGDKGNIAGSMINLNATSLEALLNMALEAEEKLYEPLSEKTIKSLNGNVVIAGTESLNNEVLLGQYVSLINELMARGENEMLASLIFENELFYSAFGTIELKEKIASLNNMSLSDKKALASAVDSRFQTFWSNARQVLTSKRGADEANRFLKQIDTAKLGYELSNF